MNKERLVELINNYPCMGSAEESFMECIADDLADYLLANGVVVPNENEVIICVTEKELHHLQNDVIAYVLKLEERGCNKDNAFGYFSRKELLVKLNDYERQYFSRYTECPAREEAEAKLKEIAE